MIYETPFELKIARRCRRGELCAKPLLHGDPCGREIAKKHGLGLCAWHSEEELGLGHGTAHDQGDAKPGFCVECGLRKIYYRVTKRCNNCHPRYLRLLESERVHVGQIVEL